MTITSGATEAIAAALLAFIEPGDEVVLFEPLYDAYLPMVRRAGGVPRIVRLQPPHWRLDRETVAAAFSDKTRVVVINTPLNPSASVMSRAELEMLAELCREHDAMCVSDEVWEHVLFDGAEHVSMLEGDARPHAEDRLGRQDVLADRLEGRLRLRRAGADGTVREGASIPDVHNTAEPAARRDVRARQAACYFDEMCAAFQRSRDRLVSALEGEGFVTLPARGAYFVSIDLPASGIAMSDEAFARHAIEHGVATIPFSAFYAAPGAPALVRLCFAKKRRNARSRRGSVDQGAARAALGRRHWRDGFVRWRRHRILLAA